MPSAVGINVNKPGFQETESRNKLLEMRYLDSIIRGAWSRNAAVNARLQSHVPESTEQRQHERTHRKNERRGRRLAPEQRRAGGLPQSPEHQNDRELGASAPYPLPSSRPQNGSVSAAQGVSGIGTVRSPRRLIPDGKPSRSRLKSKPRQIVEVRNPINAFTRSSWSHQPMGQLRGVGPAIGLNADRTLMACGTFRKKITGLTGGIVLL
jgi:hypothetical protein